MTSFFQTLNVGDRVVLMADSSYHGSLYHSRFHGRAGAVGGKQGECYKIQFKDGNKEKMLIVHPLHLRKM